MISILTYCHFFFSECNAGCVGLERCTATSINDQTCCNYFDVSDSCVPTCTTDSTPNANSSCVCDEGFEPSGSTCVVEGSHRCEPNPCQNGGTCNPMRDTFNCSCRESRKGILCSECNDGFLLSPANTCVMDRCEPNPCQNGGTCTFMGDNFTCSCGESWKGMVCSECNDGFSMTPANTCVNRCDPNPCQNGGTCNPMGDTFNCSCGESSKGMLCSECNDGFSMSSSGSCRETTGLSPGAGIAIGKSTADSVYSVCV